MGKNVIKLKTFIVLLAICVIASSLASGISWISPQQNSTGNFTETDPVFLSQNASLARTGNCPSGFAVQNTTNSGVQCINITAMTFIETDPIFLNENASLWAEARNKFNATYDRFAYNQTYNGSTFNATYALFAYNQSSAGDNASWNESRANSLYYSINNTLNFINRTQADGFYIDLAENASLWLEAKNKFNITYQRFAYNETNATLTILNMTNCANNTFAIGIALNGTFICLSPSSMGTFNATYDRFAYNQTYNGSTFNATYALFAYNQSSTSTFNITYDGFINGKLNTTDQRYNDTALINSTNVSLTASKLNISDQRYNDTTFINAVNNSLEAEKLNISDQRYNDTSLILSSDDWNVSGNNLFQKNPTLNVSLGGVSAGINKLFVNGSVTTNHNVTFTGLATRAGGNAVCRSPNGEIVDSGATICTVSGRVYKTNITRLTPSDMTDILNDIVATPLSSFNYNQTFVSSNLTFIGLIADEAPARLRTTDVSKNTNIDMFSAMLGYTWGGIKALDSRVNAVNQSLENLRLAQTGITKNITLQNSLANTCQMTIINGIITDTTCR